MELSIALSPWGFTVYERGLEDPANVIAEHVNITIDSADTIVVAAEVGRETRTRLNI